jgi:hypothetical protein
MCERTANTERAPLRPFYNARLSDLGPSDYVVAECACGHVEMLTAGMPRFLLPIQISETQPRERGQREL